MSERGLTPDVSAAINKLREESQPYWGAYGVPVTIRFPAANTDLDVAHGVGQVPAGYHVVEADGPVARRPGPWATKDLAYLRSTVAGTRATVIFFTLRETRNET